MKTRCISEYLSLALTLMYLFLLNNHSLLPDFEVCNIVTCHESWVSIRQPYWVAYSPTASTFCNMPRCIVGWPSARRLFIKWKQKSRSNHRLDNKSPNQSLYVGPHCSLGPQHVRHLLSPLCLFTLISHAAQQSFTNQIPDGCWADCYPSESPQLTSFMILLRPFTNTLQ